MICQKCELQLDPNDTFCQNCGTRNTGEFAAPVVLDSQKIEINNPQVEKITRFFKNTFWGIVKTILTSPIQGTISVFNQAGHESYSHAIILIVTTGLAFFIFPLLFFNRYVGNHGVGIFFKIGIVMSLILTIISILTYFVKGISGKPDFRKELLTGGVCGIPLIFWLIYTCLFSSTLFSGFNIFTTSSSIGFWAFMIYLFVLLMLINIVQQSLKSSSTNDGLSWYISPVIILFSFYIGFKIGGSLFGLH